MEDTALATLMLVAATIVLAGMTAGIVVRKVARDRAERASTARRLRFMGAAARGRPGELAAILREATRRLDAARDLVVALELAGGDAAGWARLRLTEPPASPSTTDSQEQQVFPRLPTQGELAARHALQDVIAMLADRRAVRRGLAVLLLTRLRADGADALVAPLLRDRDSDVRLAAAGGLAHLRTPVAARVLIDGLATGAMQAERIVERLADRWAVPELTLALARAEAPQPPALDERLERRVKEQPGDWPVRAALARALGLAGAPEAEGLLRDMLASHDTEERVSAARALATCGSDASVEPLTAALADDAWPVRVQAARALGTLGAVATAPELVGLLADRAWWVRQAAADALTHLGPTGLRLLEQAAADHPDRYARERAAAALALAAPSRSQEPVPA